MLPKIAERIADQPASAPARQGFLDTITIEHGPLALLGRFFGDGDRLLRDHGISLVAGTLDDAVAAQQKNDGSWHSYPPMLDPRLNLAGEDSSYCLLGLDPEGAIVSVQAGRRFPGGDTLKEWTDSGRFIYGLHQKLGPHFQFDLTAPAATLVRAPFVYSGALWVHPRYRGSRLAGVLVRLSCAYALARWNTRYTVAFVSEEMAQSPMPRIYGYSRIEPGVRATNLPDGGTWSGRLMWMDQAELVGDLADFLVKRLPQIDRAVIGRAADQYP